MIVVGRLPIALRKAFVVPHPCSNAPQLGGGLLLYVGTWAYTSVVFATRRMPELSNVHWVRFRARCDADRWKLINLALA